MKLSFYFLTAIVALFITNASAQNLVENATNVAVLVPATGYSCKLTTKPCAVTNKAAERTITVRIEETFIVNNELHKKTIVLERVAPGENRYIGCAGTIKDGLSEESTGYKILLAYYDEPVADEVRAVLSNN